MILDFIFVKLGCYFLNIQGASQVVDLIAYGGYKFVGCAITSFSRYMRVLMSFFSVIVTITAGFLGFSGPLWILVFVYSFLATAFFLVRPRLPALSVLTKPFVSFGHYAQLFSQTPQYPYQPTRTLPRPSHSILRNDEGELHSSFSKQFCRLSTWLFSFAFELDFGLGT